MLPSSQNYYDTMERYDHYKGQIDFFLSANWNLIDYNGKQGAVPTHHLFHIPCKSSFIITGNIKPYNL